MAKLSPSDGNALAVQAMGGVDDDPVDQIASDSSGALYVTGTFKGVSDFGPYELTSAGNRDNFAW